MLYAYIVPKLSNCIIFSIDRGSSRRRRHRRHRRRRRCSRRPAFSIYLHNIIYYYNFI